jgi:uncharacterized membrane protein YeaQ/YmgE (transglycosylase-associated protein family)
MEEVFQGIGVLGLIFLLLVGLLAGWIASKVAGDRHRGQYMAIGVVGALAAPFLLAALGVGLLALGGLVAVLAAAVVGAVIVLIVAKLIFD